MVKIPKILILFLIVGSVLSFGFSAQVFQGFAQNNLPLRVRQPTQKTDMPAYAADQMIVKFKSGLPPSAIEQLKAEHGAVGIRASKFDSFVTLSLPEGSNIYEKAEIFTKNPLVEYAHPNFFAQASFVPNDEIYNYQWHFDDDNTNNPGSATTNPFGGVNGGGIGMEQAWNISVGSASVTVAVLDTGVAYERFSDTNPAGCYDFFGRLRRCSPRIKEYYQAPDLAGTTFSILPGSDLVNSDDHPNDDEGHGTHVTGTIAQSTDNTIGVAGIAFNTTIMPVKVLDANGSGLLDVIAEAIYFATNNGADIINMSLGIAVDAQVIKEAVEYAFNSGVTVIAAVGNSFEQGNPVEYPAGYDAYVIAVGATRYDETRSYYSNTGSHIDVTAPGGDVTVDQNEDAYADGVLQQTFGDDPSDLAYFFFQGTSMAAPHVSGLAALILSVDNNLSPSQVRSVIESTAEDKGAAGRDNEFGFGIIDAYAALSSLVPAVSISLTTNGLVEFGTVALGAMVDSLSDIETIMVDTGPADLDVKSTVFSDGSNTWSLGSSNGENQVKWEFSPDGTSWNSFIAADTLSNLVTSVPQGNTQDLYLRLTMPTDTDSTSQYSSTVTIVATAP